jgi:hypothetical protein
MDAPPLRRVSLATFGERATLTGDGEIKGEEGVTALGLAAMMPTASLIHSPSTSQGSLPLCGLARSAARTVGNGVTVRLKKGLSPAAHRTMVPYHRMRAARDTPRPAAPGSDPDRLAQIAHELNDGECLVRLVQ